MRAALVLVPVARLLDDPLAGLDQVDLARGLVLDGPPERAQRVQVLDLAAGAELGVAGERRTDTLASTRIEPSSILPSDAPVATRMARSSLTYALAWSADAQVGPRHDLDAAARRRGCSRRASVGAVDAAAAADVGGLAGVLLDVGPLDADPRAVGQLEPAVDVDRLVVLADLVVLRHVRIEVVLPGEDRRRDRRSGAPAPMRMAQLDGLLVEHRQRAGQAEAHRADVGVGLVAELVGQPQNSFVRGGQLGVDLEPDHHLPAVEWRSRSWRRSASRSRPRPGT